MTGAAGHSAGGGKAFPACCPTTPSFTRRTAADRSSTSTPLEMGLNLPARQVVLYDLQRFDGRDFVALSVNTVWQVLTDYENLQNVVPNLVVNEVEELYSGVKVLDDISGGAPSHSQCEPDDGGGTKPPPSQPPALARGYPLSQANQSRLSRAIESLALHQFPSE